VTFLHALCETFAVRLGRDVNCISQELKRRFVQAVLPLLELSLLGKSLGVINMGQAAIRHLSWVAPVCSMLSMTLFSLPLSNTTCIGDGEQPPAAWFD